MKEMGNRNGYGEVEVRKIVNYVTHIFSTSSTVSVSSTIYILQ